MIRWTCIRNSMVDDGLAKQEKNRPQQPWYSLVLPEESLDSKVYEANMGPIWGRQDPGGPHVGPMNVAICARLNTKGGH